ncbi:hypothetical protein P152DRAFT_454367 [Eremomyces bilateralis CBS 781.70]|uniref:Uncharacterized protein n=1 Tax=Eremomyces bilateralis CBS 781.70 TaxID=1392243 RepID=A0A6G1GDK9_9PEZI|nr:uncharacterized protein P152DRAFT_454367 [Eremomyces bilateralis CBS 781.70]KAF1816128.1 hypothetical protein P152DRAFT_454367 [Eremomyces bilateralis CBS 781.70]
MLQRRRQSVVPAAFCPMPTAELSDAERRKIQQIQEKQDLFHQKLKRRGLGRYEEKAIACSSAEEFAGFWTEFSDHAQVKFENRHIDGWRRRTRKFQSFAEGVRTFMDEIKPVLDACREMGKPYSGFAIGTMAILFVVGSNKHRIENQLLSTLTGIKDRLPGIKILAECCGMGTEYEMDLKLKMQLAHWAFTDLAIEMVGYYIDRGYRRWMIAIFRSGKFKDMIDTVNTSVIAVRSRCEELAILNINQIKETNDELLKKMHRYQLGQGSDYLMRLLEPLGIPTWSLSGHHKRLADYQRSIEAEQFYEGSYENMTGMSLERFHQQETSFIQWSQSSDAAMLILTGANNCNITELKQHCWISPVAIDMARKYRDQGITHAFYPFQERRATSISTAVPIIVTQLLGFKLRELDGHQMDIIAHARAFSRTTDADEETRATALSRLLNDTIKIFQPEERVVLIIDRVDICDESERDGFLRMLVSMLNEACCTLKILLVTQSVVDWRPNVRELRSRLRTSAGLHQALKVQRFRSEY